MATRAPVSGRAGQYIMQPQGYRAFIPALLPPEPPVELGNRMPRLLSEADIALGRLDGSVQTLPNPDLFVFMYVRKEAVLSSQIEGTQSSLQDVLAAEAQIYAADRPQDVGEVVNYVNAINYGLERLSSLPVSVRLIREIHEKLLAGVRGSHLAPGELRRTQNWIGPAGAPLSAATFVPPPANEVPQALGDLERFLHGDDSSPLLVKIGLAHAQFETIHPFLDGNGRVGRLLITLLLSERNVLLKPVLYLSHHFKLHRAEYYDRLQAVRDSGDWEGWLEFFLRGVAAVSAQATETARKILLLREAHRSLIADRLGRVAGNGHRTLDLLFERPIISVAEIRELTRTSFPAANLLVGKLIEIGVLSEMTGRVRHRRFRYHDYIALFEDGQS
ncbi:MAG: Fic family protein [SAR202 cluster bacterium]|nr:Fic family protein [SAR202 cluster bacterium]